MKYNEKMQTIRENNGKSDYMPEGVSEYDVRCAMYIYGKLLASGPRSTDDLAHEEGITRAPMYRRIRILQDMGLVTGERDYSRFGKPYMYSAIDGRMPAGYTKESCMAMKNPLITKSNHTGGPVNGERLERARDNALTKALAKKDQTIPVESLESYKRFVKDLGSLKYGIKELDDIIGEAINLAIDRCNNVDRRCPLCNGRLRQFGTEARCLSKKCGVAVDSKKSFETSMKMLSALAASEKE